MDIRYRRRIGGLAIAAFSIFYYFFVITVAIMRLPDLALPWHLLFYFLSVVIWFIPCAAIVWWVGR
jgi:hypothetical protein